MQIKIDSRKKKIFVEKGKLDDDVSYKILLYVIVNGYSLVVRSKNSIGKEVRKLWKRPSC